MTRESASRLSVPCRFFDDVLLLPRASLFVAEAERMDAIAAMQKSQPWLCRLEGQALRDLVPPLNVAFSVGLLDPEGRPQCARHFAGLSA